jgi:putative ABC transport system permease protein
MLRNYLNIAWRQLTGSAFYSVINIAGLALGLASCFLVYVYVADELSYDRFHEKRDRIYRIVETFKTGESLVTTGLTPYKLAPDLKQQFPEIEKVVRIDYDIASDIVQYGDKQFLQKGITAVDPDFFDVFSFRLLEGNPKTALVEPNTVVISDEKARLYFPAGDAMGKVLNFKNPYHRNVYTARVTGIFKAMPRNSHLHKDFLLSMPTADALIPDRKESLGWTSHFSYLLLTPGTDPKSLEQKINDYIFKTYPKDATAWWAHFPLQPLTDIHLHSNLKEELEPNGDAAYVNIFSVVALIILALACINYMNLATARAATRAKEIGVRKVAGASKKQLVFQFMAESLVVCAFALLIGVGLVVAFLPLFNFLSGKELRVDFLAGTALVEFAGLALLVGVAAGTYPALVLSAFRPVMVLKGSAAKAGFRSLLLRKGLVVLQFSISILLIIGTLTIYRQWNYLQNKKLGIHSEQTLVIPVQTRKQDFGFPVLKRELLRNPAVLQVTATEKDITHRFGSYTSVIAAGREVKMPRAEVDADFFKTFGVAMMAGTNFSPVPDTNALPQYVVNEAAFRLLGTKDLVGREITDNGQKGTVVGVVKDFHFESLHSEISPIIFRSRTYGFNYFVVKLKTADLRGAIAAIEGQYKKIDPEAPFQYTFLDDNIEALYRAEARFFAVFTTFSGLAIFIACIGVFGLAAFTAQQRTKEIGIRKVLGASVRSVVGLLSGDFIRLVLLANLVAWPPALYFMNRWLAAFPYKIGLEAWIFVAAAAVALCIAGVTVSFQSLKAALANPVTSLRSE